MNKKPVYPGLLVSFEGSEGSGKSTQIALLAKRLQSHGASPVITREPGGTEIGESIRHLIKHDERGSKMFPETELLLFAASRAQLVREVIYPGLSDGKIILCDRYLDSTTVYQGVARNIGSDPVQMINEFAVGNLMPNVTLVLDIDPTEGFRRVAQRGSKQPDRMESESIEFYQQVREGYLLLAKSLPERFVIIEGNQDKDRIAEQIWNELTERFTTWPR